MDLIQQLAATVNKSRNLTQVEEERDEQVDLPAITHIQAHARAHTHSYTHTLKWGAGGQSQAGGKQTAREGGQVGEAAESNESPRPGSVPRYGVHFVPMPTYTRDATHTHTHA